MLKDGVIVPLLTVAWVMTGPATGCFHDMTSTCPFYPLVSQVTLIPLPDPGNLDVLCSQLQLGLRCLLRPSVLGNCDLATRTVYSSILNVLQYPCQRMRSDYLAGSECWSSAAFKTMMKVCYFQNRIAINADYCSGQRAFVNCTLTEVLKQPHCGSREQTVLATMVVTNYNDNGLVMTSPCRRLAMPQLSTTTTTTTTTTSPTTTNITTMSPGVQSSTGASSSSKGMTTSRSSEGDATTSGTGSGKGKLMTQASRGGSGASTGVMVPPALAVYGAAVGGWWALLTLAHLV